LVVGVVIGAGPLLLVLLVRGRGSRQDAQATASAPRRRTALALGVGGACLLLPIVAAVAAVVLYPPYPRVEAPRIAGEPEAPPELPASPLPPDDGPPPSKSTGEPREIQASEFHPGVDIRFNQVDPTSGLVLINTHVFRELLPDSPRVFVVKAEDETHGTIQLYRLRNADTGEAFDFADVPVRKISTAGWVIEQDVGWKMIRDQLQAKMKIQLAMPIIGRP
jgi:hypothetical protein